jgi:deoxyribonuclease-4
MRLGLHVSSAGKIFMAPDRAQEMGCECLQMFVGSPRGWAKASFTDDDLAEFRKRATDQGISPIIIHASYLINLASGNSDLRHTSADKLLETLHIAQKVGASDVVFHIGSHQGDGTEAGFDRLKSALSIVLQSSEDTRITLEPGAGGGNQIGSTLDELAALIAYLTPSERFAVCLDTAHMFAAGIDVTNPETFDKFVSDFDKKIGLNKLTVLHLNDSQATLGSHWDRHDNIGDGNLGLDTFRHILNHSRLQHLPAIMETPGFEKPLSNSKNIEVMKSLRETT